jgi:hypothetical protein
MKELETTDFTYTQTTPEKRAAKESKKVDRDICVVMGALLLTACVDLYCSVNASAPQARKSCTLQLPLLFRVFPLKV